MLRWTILAAVLLLPMATAAQNQSFCALRDPDQYVYGLFPQADSYRSVVKDVDEDTRLQLASMIPLELHPSEVGKHTLYLVWDGDEILGLVHARSEASKWGMVEFAWALDAELRVMNFLFIRCRDPSKKYFEDDDSIRSTIIGSDIDDLFDLLDEESLSITPEAVSLNQKAHDLGTTLVHSAIKTIVVTRLIGSEVLIKLATPSMSTR